MELIFPFISVYCMCQARVMQTAMVFILWLTWPVCGTANTLYTQGYMGERIQTLNTGDKHDQHQADRILEQQTQWLCCTNILHLLQPWMNRTQHKKNQFIFCWKDIYILFVIVFDNTVVNTTHQSPSNNYSSMEYFYGKRKAKFWWKKDFIIIFRYIYWNSHFYGSNFYGWSIGDVKSLTESGPFHSQGKTLQ